MIAQKAECYNDTNKHHENYVTQKIKKSYDISNSV